MKVSATPSQVPLVISIISYAAPESISCNGNFCGIASTYMFGVVLLALRLINILFHIFSISICSLPSASIDFILVAHIRLQYCLLRYLPGCSLSRSANVFPQSKHVLGLHSLRSTFNFLCIVLCSNLSYMSNQIPLQRKDPWIFWKRPLYL